MTGQSGEIRGFFRVVEAHALCIGGPDFQFEWNSQLEKFLEIASGQGR
jgi:hypothetical protein